MKPEDYVEFCARTESIDGALDRLEDVSLMRLLHSALGVCTEAGEFTDIVKRRVFYGKQIDIRHLEEEAGDILWYLAIALKVSGSSFSRVMDMNISKLQARYPEKFTNEAALGRDLDAERAALELNYAVKFTEEDKRKAMENWPRPCPTLDQCRLTGCKGKC